MIHDSKTSKGAAILPAAKPAVPAKAATPRLREDREFLPAALEILVSPPSPVATTLLLTICALFFSAICWSYFGWIDIHAIAPGKIQPNGRSKVVQTLAGGRISAIDVQNGSRVHAGEVLLTLDSTEAIADRDAQARDLEAARGEVARRKAAIAAVRTGSFHPLPIDFPASVSEPIRKREQGVLSAEMAKLRSTIASFKAQLSEKTATKERLTATIAERTKLIALSQERVAMRKQLQTKGASSRALVIEAMQQYETQVASDVQDRGELVETDAAMRSLGRKLEEAITGFISDQSQKLADAENKRDGLEEALIKAKYKLKHMTLRAPIDGTVQQLAVTTIGQVVAPGQSLMALVPIDAPVEIEAMIANQDIGFVAPGQSAVIKVDAFPFTRYGTIDGTVTKVSRDAVDSRNASALSDAMNAARLRPTQPAQPPKPQDLVFPATLKLSRDYFKIGDKEVKLKPGMAVTVEINTGKRRVIDYL
ncbi:MAG TPA: HlyD family type I secretion periplasmic adaptor subunit, partial [Lacipirellulaceae bacterium]|nr:HlyD family type I secretion periplasmic adaptor subunit [Lacipirellulaceae bacterium]